MGIGFYANPNTQGTIENCSFKGLGIGIGYGEGAQLVIKGNDFNTINKYLEIYGKNISDTEISDILEENTFDAKVKLVEQSPTAILVIVDEG